MILTTHELAEAERLADRVIILDQGRILAEGAPSDLAPRAPTAPSASPPTRGSTCTHLLETLTDRFGTGARLEEELPGTYRLNPPDRAAAPEVIATLAGWMAERNLRSRRSPDRQLSGGGLPGDHRRDVASADSERRAPTSEAPATTRNRRRGQRRR